MINIQNGQSRQSLVYFYRKTISSTQQTNCKSFRYSPSLGVQTSSQSSLTSVSLDIIQNADLSDNSKSNYLQSHNYEHLSNYSLTRTNDIDTVNSQTKQPLLIRSLDILMQTNPSRKTCTSSSNSDSMYTYTIFNSSSEHVNIYYPKTLIYTRDHAWS